VYAPDAACVAVFWALWFKLTLPNVLHTQPHTHAAEACDVCGLASAGVASVGVLCYVNRANALSPAANASAMTFPVCVCTCCGLCGGVMSPMGMRCEATRLTGWELCHKAVITINAILLANQHTQTESAEGQLRQLWGGWCFQGSPILPPSKVDVSVL